MLRRPVLRQFSQLSRSHFSSSTRTPLRFGRIPTNLENGTPVKIYRVRFAKPPIYTWKRWRKPLWYAFVSYAIFYYVLPQFITVTFEELPDEAVTEDGEAGAESEEGDDEEAEDGLFIPCGWPKKQPRTFYRASDPEWQEFIKFSKEKEKHKDAQLRLVSSVRSEVANLRGAKRILGDIKMDKGRYWLEIIFPDGPPQDYEVNGIEITDEFIAWAVKTIPQKDYQQLYRTIIPTAAMQASWVSFKYQFDLQANKIREYFGLQPKFDPETALIMASMKHQAAMKKAKEDGTMPRVPPNPLLPGALSPPPVLPSDSTKEVDTSDADASKVGIPRLPSIVPQRDGQPVTLALFMHNLRKNHKALAIEPPRGSVVITGFIEVLGTRGRTTLDVSAAFDPKSNEYVAWSWRPRRIHPHQQKPKGGP